MGILEKLEEVFNKPKLIDFYNVFHELHLLLDSGSTVQQALIDVSTYVENKKLAEALKGISRSLASGISTGAAFKKEAIFPPVVAPTIEAGDRAGELSGTFLRLADVMWLQHNLYTKVQNALFTPKLAAVLMIIMSIAYVKLAIPEFLKLYAENGIEVPAIISVVSGAVNTIVDYWYVTLLVIILGWNGSKWFAEYYTEVVDGWRLKLPIYNKLHKMFLQHQFSSVISLMLASGLTVPEALGQACKVVSNILMKEDLHRVRNDVLRGHTLTLSMKKNNHNETFSNMLIASINAGERSNQLVVALEKNCEYLEKSLNNTIEPTSTKITLLVLIPMGILIIAMYLFTMVPMLNYMGQIK